MKCSWCKGIKVVKLKGKGTVPCLNCKGSGEGQDGGRLISSFKKPWMIGNTYAMKGD
jgi:hypothetical protein